MEEQKGGQESWLCKGMVVVRGQEGMGYSWFVLQEDIVLGRFWEVSCDAWANLAWFPVISKIHVVSVYQDRDFYAFQQIGPASQSSHYSQKFPIIDWVILFGRGEFLEVESTWALGSWFLSSIREGNWQVVLVQDSSCTNKGCISLQFKLL